MLVIIVRMSKLFIRYPKSDNGLTNLRTELNDAKVENLYDI